MINSLQGIDPGDLYSTDGKDVWEVKSMCHSPTITLVNLKTGEQKGGGVGCLLLEPFKKLVIEK